MSREDEVSVRAWSRRDRAVALLLYLAAFLLMLLAAGSTQSTRAETVPELHKRTLLLTASFCGNRKDAELLASMIAHGGEEAGRAFMKKSSNTCSVGELTVEVGKVVKVFKQEGRPWWIAEVQWFPGFGKKNILFLVAPTISLGEQSQRPAVRFNI